MCSKLKKWVQDAVNLFKAVFGWVDDAVKKGGFVPAYLLLFAYGLWSTLNLEITPAFLAPLKAGPGCADDARAVLDDFFSYAFVFSLVTFCTHQLIIYLEIELQLGKSAVARQAANGTTAYRKKTFDEIVQKHLPKLMKHWAHRLLFFTNALLLVLVSGKLTVLQSGFHTWAAPNAQIQVPAWFPWQSAALSALIIYVLINFRNVCALIELNGSLRLWERKWRGDVDTQSFIPIFLVEFVGLIAAVSLWVYTRQFNNVLTGVSAVMFILFGFNFTLFLFFTRLGRVWELVKKVLPSTVVAIALLFLLFLAHIAVHWVTLWLHI